MAFRRVYNQYLTSAANSTVQTFTLNTPDNWQQQRLKRIFVGFSTTGTELGIQLAGDQIVTVDATRFAAGNKDLEVDAIANPGIPFVATVHDLAGTARTNLAFMIEYEVDTG